MAKILVVDDERSIRNSMKEVLEFEGHVVTLAEDGETGLKEAEKEQFDLVFSDIKMPKMDGIELLAKMRQLQPSTKMILISGHGTIETAVQCMRNGAFDFIEKPMNLNRLLQAVKEAMSSNSTESSNLRAAISNGVKKATGGVVDDREMVGQSEQINHLRALIDRVAPTDARILITGENGTGKEVVAHQIYARSARANKSFIEVNCAAIPSELIESELFGHEKGAFTSALKQRIGKFEQADGGTLFLDEIGDMSLAAQTKVLRVLQEGVLTRVGGDKAIKVDVRVIAATNKNLKHEIEKGNFREDLYHRLSVIPLCVPPLRERKDDIPLLVEYFINKYDSATGQKHKFEKSAMAHLQSFEWNGNIRELKNVVERLAILCNDAITEDDVKNYARPVFL
ncbi:MAG: sigma-54-dependent Fis family transcriptional regulator [Paludibacteraceae bacterium]|nr:sigma-54-dependent Fis family transcriptional regulator [Paludibacteraceae bacterium]